jgi:small subunit ribosomal protein S6
MKYTLTFLLKEEEELKTLKSLLESFKAKIVKEEDWGDKKLAYQIKKFQNAHYYHWEIEMNDKKVNELKRKLDFDEKLIRYLLLKLEV